MGETMFKIRRTQLNFGYIKKVTLVGKQRSCGPCYKHQSGPQNIKLSMPEVSAAALYNHAWFSYNHWDTDLPRYLGVLIGDS